MTEHLVFAYTTVKDIINELDIPDADRAEALHYLRKSREAAQQRVIRLVPVTEIDRQARGQGGRDARYP